MPHSGPDDGLNPGDQLIDVPDLGEVASRMLRGFGSGNRGGRLIWSSYFANGLAELIKRSAVGTGAGVAVNTAISEFGSQGIRLTAGNAIGNQTNIGLWRPGGYLSKIGFEVTIYNNVLTNNTYRWYITASVFPGGLARHNLAVRLDYLGNVSKTTNVYWYSNTATYSLAQTLNHEIVGYGFNSVKLVYDERDPANPKWDSLYLNGVKEIDLSARNVVVDNDTFARPPGILFEITFENRVAGLNPNCIIGSVVMTIDEP